MKNNWALFGMVGLASLVLNSFSMKTNGDQKEESKKTRHIKMTKIENGKKTELDTVFTNDDVFVWNGDTINPPKHKGHSGADKMQTVDVRVDNKDGNEKVMIIRHGDGKPGEPMIWNMDSGDDMEIVTENVDSLGNHMVIRKRIHGGNENHMTYPPVMPFHSMSIHTGQFINLNDPNVISYKKKDLSGGREKIEIIRKKSEGPEEMNFNFQTGDAMMPPPPPPPPALPGAPEIIREYDDAQGHVKIIEKSTKIEGKDGKQIQVEVESKETK